MRLGNEFDQALINATKRGSISTQTGASTARLLAGGAQRIEPPRSAGRKGAGLNGRTIAAPHPVLPSSTSLASLILAAR